MTIDYVARARALVGTRFRLQGRDRDGLDCVGVIVATFGLSPSAVRHDYAMRGNSLDDMRGAIDQNFRRVSTIQIRSSDVMLLAAGGGQPHLAVRTDEGFVHAHAGLRRVVETPGLPEWPILGVYRKRRGR